MFFFLRTLIFQIMRTNPRHIVWIKVTNLLNNHRPFFLNGLRISTWKPLIQFATFKLVSYRFEEAVGFDVKASLARRPVLRLMKPGDITKEFSENYFQKRLFNSTRFFMD